MIGVMAELADMLSRRPSSCTLATSARLPRLPSPKAINTLQTGSDALVLADSNEEAANLLALQARQQLSTTALSLASQADQAVLRLF